MVPVLGKGDAKFLLNGKIVQVPDCLHIPSLSSPLYSIRHHCRYAGCAFIADNDGCTLTFPDFIVSVDDSKDCLISIQPVPPNSGVDFKATTTQQSTMRRVHFTKHVSIRPCNWVNSSTDQHLRLTEHQLYCYLGNRSLQSFKEIEDIAKDNITVVNTGEISMEIGDAAKIKGSRQSNEPIPGPPTILYTMHANVSYGDSTAPGGIKYILILVDRKSRYCW
eukprot:7352532-Ditylum_brightwellii.AAC.1